QAPAKKAAAAAPPPKAATAAPPALFVVTASGESTKIDKDSFLIGRSRNCDLVIPSSKVSRQHCSVSREGNDFFVEDLGSPNGVWRDGVKITKEKVKDGDEFMISDEVLKFVFKAQGRK
ncbi:FHA domain-containing protein, partial [Myxococcota bacterium]|nr:FHA domain-containing protein [Myxococcota bacterium]